MLCTFLFLVKSKEMFFPTAKNSNFSSIFFKNFSEPIVVNLKSILLWRISQNTWNRFRKLWTANSDEIQLFLSACWWFWINEQIPILFTTLSIFSPKLSHGQFSVFYARTKHTLRLSLYILFFPSPSFYPSTDLSFATYFSFLVHLFPTGRVFNQANFWYHRFNKKKPRITLPTI